MPNWWHRLWCRDCRVASWLIKPHGTYTIKDSRFLWNCAAIMDCLDAKLRVIQRGHEFRDWSPDWNRLRTESPLPEPARFFRSDVT